MYDRSTHMVAIHRHIVRAWPIQGREFPRCDAWGILIFSVLVLSSLSHLLLFWVFHLFQTWYAPTENARSFAFQLSAYGRPVRFWALKTLIEVIVKIHLTLNA